MDTWTSRILGSEASFKTSIFSISFFALLVEACKLMHSRVATAVSCTHNLFSESDMSMSFQTHDESTSKQIQALRKLKGLETKEKLFDNIEASKRWAYLTTPPGMSTAQSISVHHVA